VDRVVLTAEINNRVAELGCSAKTRLSVGPFDVYGGSPVLGDVHHPDIREWRDTCVPDAGGRCL
jgi:hypothetical protein